MLLDYGAYVDFVELYASYGNAREKKTATRIFCHTVLMNAVRDENIGVVSAQGFI